MSSVEDKSCSEAQCLRCKKHENKTTYPPYVCQSHRQKYAVEYWLHNGTRTLGLCNFLAHCTWVGAIRSADIVPVTQSLQFKRASFSHAHTHTHPNLNAKSPRTLTCSRPMKFTLRVWDWLCRMSLFESMSIRFMSTDNSCTAWAFCCCVNLTSFPRFEFMAEMGCAYHLICLTNLCWAV